LHNLTKLPTKSLQNCLIHVLGGDWGKEHSDSIPDGWKKVKVLRSTEIKNWDTEKGKSAVYRTVKSSSLEKRKLKKGDILLEVSGGSSTFSTGRTILVDDKTISNSDSPIICSNFFRQMRFTDELLPQYVNHFLKFQYSNGRIRKFIKKTTNIQNLEVPKFLTETKIPIPSHKTQENIVSILGKSHELILTKKKIITYLQELIQAILVNMFGDPTKNPNHFPIKQLGEVCYYIKDGPHVSPKYTEHGIPFLTVHNVNKGYFDLIDTKYISKNDHKEFCKHVKPEKGDVLYTKGGTTGIAKEIDVDFEFSIWVHLALLKIKKEYYQSYILGINSKFQFL